MSQMSSPTVVRRWMATELRRLRVEAGLSQAEVAKQLGCRVPKVSLMESAQRNVQENDLDKLLRLYDVPKGRWAEYKGAAKSVRRKGWWELYDESTVPHWLEFYVGLEQGAARLRSYQPAIFHGLLQSREYATAVLRRSPIAMGEERIAEVVELRARRQAALDRQDEPLKLWAVVEEAVLRTALGSSDVMRGQLEHVLDVVGRRDNVTLQVIPADVPADHDSGYGAFSVLSFSWPSDPGVVYIEHRAGAVYLEALPEVDTHSQAFEKLVDVALSPDESLKRVRLSAEEYAR